ncbi:MAG: hypothetical protein PSV35_00510 [bacterium]|nr:hypothetical protein [bacterium]
MSFFTKIRSYLPAYTPDTIFYSRASFGAIAAYTATFNPLAGVAVLLGHGAWEWANLFLQSTINLQQKRINTYNRAFKELYVHAKQLGTQCTETEIENAKNIFFVHNLIEEIAYKALADAVIELDLCEDGISAEQSCFILTRVKDAAHVELRKEGGYTQKGREMISSEQIMGVIKNVSDIIHDRDARLTDARYFTLTDLCTAIDDHNGYVKNVLFRSWFRCDTLSSETHLKMIKELVYFNERMSEQVGFDFKRRLQQRKSYYDQKFPSIRAVVCQKTGEKSAVRFVNLTEVRAYFKAHVDELLGCDPERPLIRTLIDRCSFTLEEVSALRKERIVPCPARFGLGLSTRKINQPPLIRDELTVGYFLHFYFPERVIIAKEPVFQSIKKSIG